MSRYFTPSYIGIELAVAYLLAMKLNIISSNMWQQNIWKLVTIVVISGGLISCLISSQSDFWWNKRTNSYDQLQVAFVINQQNKPLLIVEDAFKTLPLSHILDSTVKLLIVNKTDTLEIPESNDSIFFIQPSKKLRSELEQKNHQIDIVYQGRKQSLWQLTQT